MKKISPLLALMVFALVMPGLVNARQGCCSHHGGVCGCQCCDGSSLSTKCAPYYPDCSVSRDEQSPSSSEKHHMDYRCYNKCLLKGYAQKDCENICSN